MTQIGLLRTLIKFMQRVGVKDFSMSDLIMPTSKRYDVCKQTVSPLKKKSPKTKKKTETKKSLKTHIQTN